MRYIIDTIGEKAKLWGNTFRSAEENGEIIILEKGDTIEKIKESLRKINQALDTLNKAGINDEIMIGYMRSKGISRTNIETVLYHQKEFFKKLGVYK